MTSNVPYDGKCVMTLEVHRSERGYAISDCLVYYNIMCRYRQLQTSNDCQLGELLFIIILCAGIANYRLAMTWGAVVYYNIMCRYRQLQTSNDCQLGELLFIIILCAGIANYRLAMTASSGSCCLL